jgi:hypothetical protein
MRTISPIQFAGLEMGTNMRLMAFAGVATLALCAIPPADAAPRETRVERLPPGQTLIVRRDEEGRTRTKILVQKRSYLDGGTEVMPGELGTTNYIQLPTHRPLSALGPNVVTNPPGPILDPWYLPGKRNPWPWFGP